MKLFEPYSEVNTSDLFDFGKAHVCNFYGYTFAIYLYKTFHADVIYSCYCRDDEGSHIVTHVNADD